MSLSELFVNALFAASKASNLPTIEDDAQELIGSCLKDLRTLQSRVAAISLFSLNESLEDIGTGDLIYLIVPYVLSEVQGRVRTTEMAERLYILDQAQRYLKDFSSSVENYDIVPEADRALFRHKISTIRDARQKREARIIQYQKERELRARLEAIRKRRGLGPTNADDGNDFDLISMLLPSGDKSCPSEEEDLDSESEDVLREVTLVLLRLLYTQAQNHLENMEQERELLLNAPQPERKPQKSVHREQRHAADEIMWRLDAPQSIDRGPDGKGILLDSSGKPLRPFTILPSEAANRVRLQAQAFGPGHRLPTMTIDEYLEIERQRGNIISGGGRASLETPTSTEKLTIAAEMDGTRESGEKAEELRQKQEKWAQFTEANPRGAGNTMNRG